MSGPPARPQVSVDRFQVTVLGGLRCSRRCPAVVRPGRLLGQPLYDSRPRRCSLHLRRHHLALLYVQPPAPKGTKPGLAGPPVLTTLCPQMATTGVTATSALPSPSRANSRAKRSSCTTSPPAAAGEHGRLSRLLVRRLSSRAELLMPMALCCRCAWADGAPDCSNPEAGDCTPGNYGPAETEWGNQ